MDGEWYNMSHKHKAQQIGHCGIYFPVKKKKKRERFEED